MGFGMGQDLDQSLRTLIDIKKETKMKLETQFNRYINGTYTDTKSLAIRIREAIQNNSHIELAPLGHKAVADFKELYRAGENLSEIDNAFIEWLERIRDQSSFESKFSSEVIERKFESLSTDINNSSSSLALGCLGIFLSLIIIVGLILVFDSGSKTKFFEGISINGNQATVTGKVFRVIPSSSIISDDIITLIIGNRTVVCGMARNWSEAYLIDLEKNERKVTIKGCIITNKKKFLGLINCRFN